MIIPLAPGESAWPGLLDQLKGLPVGSEVIMVAADRRAYDPPTAWPREVPVRLVHSLPGRARQQNAGARAARGKWLWFVHADTRLYPLTLAALLSFIRDRSDALGWFRLRFRTDGPWLMRLNAVGANLRSRWFGMPFGDQALVLPRHCFVALGGFDEQVACGEDHLLVWAARRTQLPLEPVPAAVSTSARKYRTHGWVRTTARHLWLTARQAWHAQRLRSLTR